MIPATLASSRSSSSASWCNASADSWGAPGKHSRMMLMLSRLPCGQKRRQPRQVINGWPHSRVRVRPDFVLAELFSTIAHFHLARTRPGVKRQLGRREEDCDILRLSELKLCYITMLHDGHKGQTQQEHTSTCGQDAFPDVCIKMHINNRCAALSIPHTVLRDVYTA